MELPINGSMLSLWLPEPELGGELGLQPEVAISDSLEVWGNKGAVEKRMPQLASMIMIDSFIVFYFYFFELLGVDGTPLVYKAMRRKHCQKFLVDGLRERNDFFGFNIYVDLLRGLCLYSCKK